MAFYERLTELDNSFLVYEAQGAPMHVAATEIFEAAPLRETDGTLDIERIQRYVLSRLHLIPRYRQRLAYTPLRRHPVWVDDDRFNIRYHVRHSRLPRPGDERLLKRTVGRIFSQQLDLAKPLWEMWVIEGLEGDRLAIVSKTHHCMIDGIAGTDLMSVLLTPEPREKVEHPPAWVPRPVPSQAELARDEALRTVGTPLAAARGAAGLLAGGERSRHDLMERLRATGRVLAGSLSGATPTPLNQPVGPYRRFDWTTFTLDEIRAIRRKLGGTVNDVVLATTAGAVRRFLRRSRQVDVDDIDFRVMAPVSVRADDERGTMGNKVAAWMVPLPIAERDPRRRLELICQTTERLKRERQALGAETLTDMLEWTGSTLLSLGARMMTLGTPFNMVVTNVPGPRAPLHLLQSQMVEAHAMIPLMGNLATGIALFSYAGTLSFGVMGDWDLVPDLHDFVGAIEHSFRALQNA
jgi:WS/DGAT/MGAT family acyltransferase